MAKQSCRAPKVPGFHSQIRAGGRREGARARTVGGQAAAAEEHGAVEDADGERQQQAREVVGGAAPVGQAAPDRSFSFNETRLLTGTASRDDNCVINQR